ncbi:MAG: enolase C-terminal domain-like protein [Candidatus Puniceispirillaceae bacterium]|jgi:L-alanine-DL-glutamate epimerase-like enolase superfamily enzyme
MSLITRVSLTAFSFEAENLAASAKGSSIGGLFYEKGARTEITKYAIRLETEDGCIGEYVLNWGASPSVFGQMQMLAPMLVGRHAEERQGIYDDLKREARQFDHMGHGPLDIALWDWQGRALNCSVSTLLGGYRKKLPAYASTYHGDRNGGLDSKEAFADFALACADMGYKAFKIHGWHEGNIREEAELVLYVRKMVGDDMTLMLDPACQLRSFADALYVGRACDDANFFWLEDPYRDSGVSAFGHQKLRSMIKTPLLQTEHIRGVEPKADFLIAGGTDFLRSDPEYDMGLTGGQKIHHLAEGFGVDVEVHACGPAHRHLMAASRNSNFYEVALVGPDCPNAVAPVYQCGYSDQLDCVDNDGMVDVPDAPGLGVQYDWDFITSHQTGQIIYD